MSTYFKQGNTVRVAPEGAVNMGSTLGSGYYTVMRDEFGNFFLSTVDEFTLPDRMYGSVNDYANRIITTFNDRERSTGVLLSGEKGSGKTLLAKVLCHRVVAQGSPVIIVNKAYVGDEFNSFIQSISEPAIVLFDEFEKTFDDEDQEKILTLLDGVYQSKKLFVLTCNDSWRLDRNMKNRPGRLYYMIEFEGLDADFIEEYCQTNLLDASKIDSVCKVAALFDQFNFDMLQTLVEELNRFGGTAQEAVSLLNIKPTSANISEFSCEVFVDQKLRRKNATWHGNPLSESVIIPVDSDDDDTPVARTSAGTSIDCEVEVPRREYDNECVVMQSNDIIKVDAKKGVFVFENSEGHRIVMRRVNPCKFNYNVF